MVSDSQASPALAIGREVEANKGEMDDRSGGKQRKEEMPQSSREEESVADMSYECITEKMADMSFESEGTGKCRNEV